MNTPIMKMNDSWQIPQVGLGLWQVKNDAKFNQAFRAAWNAGYRHFDSAQFYQNEDLLGKVWKQMGLKRKELFITTKIKLPNFGARRTAKSIEKSLADLQTEYIDLMLLHFPVTSLRKGSWKALEEAKAAGKIRSIGVSNYTIKHLEEMKSYAREMPVVNQVELHVFLQQPELIRYCARKGIVVEAYSPLAHAKDMDEPAILEVAKKHGVSYVQVMLRWCVQKNLVVLPKSVTPERIRQNINVFDFELDDLDMEKLSKLDRNLRTCWDPTHVP